MNLDELLNAPVPPTAKGWPAVAGALPLGEVGRRGWNLLREDLPLPVAVLKASALAHNSRWMRGFLEHFDVRLCPHGKTTMAPQLFARQLGDGAWGITVATVQQLMVCRRFGVPRVLMANQLVGRQAIRAVLAELQADPGFEFLCLVDSLDGVELLRRELEQMPLGRPFEVLLEGGVAGGRTGCRTAEEALAVARAIAAVPELALVGIEGFEDVVGGDIADAEPKIAAFLGVSGRPRQGLRRRGPVRARAGDPERRRLEILRSGDPGVSHGATSTARSRSCCAAAATSATIPRSTPTRSPGCARARPRSSASARASGRRWSSGRACSRRPSPASRSRPWASATCPTTSTCRSPRQWFRPGLHQRPQDLGPGFQVIGLYDQHTCLRVPADSPLRVGDLVSFGISHPCTTFDKWQLLYVVDDDYTVTEAIRTFF